MFAIMTGCHDANDAITLTATEARSRRWACTSMARLISAARARVKPRPA
jgi:hypothetical protein